MINNDNFYKEFDILYDELNIDNNELYLKFIDLYEKYAFNYKDNNNLFRELKTCNFEIDNDGLLKNVEEL
jgi:hypothetical protein|tara:strand:- start:2337 stop:2546 length:210 start_codon:yes stop_codon:yes gene_type:complete